MSYEHVEHKIKTTLESLHSGSMWFLPDNLFDDALDVAYKQGQIDGAMELDRSIGAALDTKRGGA